MPPQGRQELAQQGRRAFPLPVSQAQRRQTLPGLVPGPLPGRVQAESLRIQAGQPEFPESRQAAPQAQEQERLPAQVPPLGREQSQEPQRVQQGKGPARLGRQAQLRHLLPRGAVPTSAQKE